MATFSEDIFVNGTFTARVLRLVNGVTDTEVAPAAGIQASKLQHEHRTDYGQPNAAATSEARVVHVVQGATGKVKAFAAGAIVKAVGDSTVTVDLRKNGTTVLSSAVTLNASGANYTPVAGTVSVTTLAAGDVLTVVITISAGTGTLPTGVYASLDLVEDAVV
jgi:hypothetical protein